MHFSPSRPRPPPLPPPRLPQVTGIFAIIICGTLGVMAIHLSSSRLLEPAATEGKEEEEEEVAGGEQGAGVGEKAAPAAAGLAAVTVGIEQQQVTAVRAKSLGVSGARFSSDGDTTGGGRGGSFATGGPGPGPLQRRSTSAVLLSAEQVGAVGGGGVGGNGALGMWWRCVHCVRYVRGRVADGPALHRFRLTLAAPTPPQPPPPLLPLPPQGAGTSTADYELLAEYLDSIRQLTSAVYDDKRSKADLARLSDRVLATQRVRGGGGRRGEGGVRGRHVCCLCEECIWAQEQHK